MWMFRTVTSFAFVDELVNLNTLLPVLHLGGLDVLGSGIAKVPDTTPFASVVKLPPNAPLMSSHMQLY